MGTVAQWSAAQNSAAEQVMNEARRLGATNAGGAGMVGNFAQESSLNPGLYDPPGAVGIASFTDGGTWQGLQAYANQRNAAWQSVAIQVDYIWATMGSELKQILTTTADPGNAALAVMNLYERPAGTPSSLSSPYEWNYTATTNTTYRRDSAILAYDAYNTGKDQTAPAQVGQPGGEQLPSPVSGASGEPPVQPYDPTLSMHDGFVYFSDQVRSGRNLSDATSSWMSNIDYCTTDGPFYR
jgi:hypothetical protein